MSDPRSTPFTILVIDDEQLIRETTAELLQKDGYLVLAASSGEVGLAMVQAVRPDLILVDYHMPGMNGLAVVERLKADEVTRRIPVVALTSGTAEHANELSRAGCDDRPNSAQLRSTAPILITHGLPAPASD